MIENESQVTREWAVALRKELELSQREFWAPAMISPLTMVRYESGQLAISGRAKRLLFMHYVIGIDLSGKLESNKAIADKNSAAKLARKTLIKDLRALKMEIIKLNSAVNKAIEKLEVK